MPPRGCDRLPPDFPLCRRALCHRRRRRVTLPQPMSDLTCSVIAVKPEDGAEQLGVVSAATRRDRDVAAASPAAAAAASAVPVGPDRAVFPGGRAPADVEAAAEEGLARGLHGGAADAAVRPEEVLFQPQVRNLAPRLMCYFLGWLLIHHKQTCSSGTWAKPDAAHAHSKVC